MKGCIKKYMGDRTMEYGKPDSIGDVDMARILVLNDMNDTQSLVVYWLALDTIDRGVPALSGGHAEVDSEREESYNDELERMLIKEVWPQ